MADYYSGGFPTVICDILVIVVAEISVMVILKI